MTFAFLPLIIIFALSLSTNAVRAEKGIANLHFIDVEDGHAILIDIDDYEILIDGGGRSNLPKREKNKSDKRINLLKEYIDTAGQTIGKSIIDGPLDLVIITQSDRDAYRNFFDLLRQSNGVDGSTNTIFPEGISRIHTLGLLEELGPKCGYNDRTRYKRFIDFLRSKFEDQIQKPIYEIHIPILETGVFEETNIDEKFPGKFYLLNAGPGKNPEKFGQCSSKRNDASMAIGLEIFGLRLLVGGDVSSGYDRRTGRIKRPAKEEQLVETIAPMPWFHNVDILVAPRRGSWTANSPNYIEMVSPKIALFGTSPLFGHPGREVVNDYVSQGAKVLSTAHSELGGLHNIVCAWSDPSDVNCDYGQINSDGKVMWTGISEIGEKLTQRKLESILRSARRDRRRHERSAYGPQNIEKLNYLANRFSLFGVDLAGKDLSSMDLTKADLRYANLRNANLTGTILTKARLDHADLSGATIVDAHIEKISAVGITATDTIFSGSKLTGSKFSNSDLSGAKFDRSILQKMEFVNTKLDGVLFEPDNFSLVGSERAFERIDNIDRLDNLQTFRFSSSSVALQKLKKYFLDSGQRSKEADVIYAIELSKQPQFSPPMAFLRYVCCELVTEYGRAPNRPIILLFLGIPVFSILYLISILRVRGAGIFAVQSSGTGPSILQLSRPVRIHHTDWRAILSALYFSFISAFHFGWRDINVGTWAQKLSPTQFNLDATGWVRIVSGVQSMISFFLIVMWALMFFGNPFR